LHLLLSLVNDLSLSLCVISLRLDLSGTLLGWAEDRNKNEKRNEGEDKVGGIRGKEGKIGFYLKRKKRNKILKRH
jgi:hypothetical protein